MPLRAPALRSALLTGAFIAVLAGVAPAAVLAAAPDLAVSVTASPDPAAPGDSVTVRVTARNLGDASAPEASIGVVAVGDGKFVEADECVNFGGVLAICGIGTLSPGETVKRSFTLTNLKPGSLTLQASVSYQGADLKPGDNIAAAVLTVEPRADLKLEFESVTTSYKRNTATIVAVVRNAGAGPARNARLQLNLGQDLIASSPPDGCSQVSAKLTCDLGTVAAKAVVRRTFSLNARKDVTVSVLGSATFAKPDPTPADNQAQALITTELPLRTVPIASLARGVPAVCIRGTKLRLRMVTSDSSAMTSADVLVSGRRVRRLTGAALRMTVQLRGLPRKMFTLRVTAHVRDSGRLTGVRKLRACRA